MIFPDTYRYIYLDTSTIYLGFHCVINDRAAVPPCRKFCTSSLGAPAFRWWFSMERITWDPWPDRGGLLFIWSNGRHRDLIWIQYVLYLIQYDSICFISDSIWFNMIQYDFFDFLGLIWLVSSNIINYLLHIFLGWVETHIVLDKPPTPIDIHTVDLHSHGKVMWKYVDVLLSTA